jgi:predicted enzyme related to lactoylglutathione lyase
MADTTGRPMWIDLASKDPAGSRAFYSQLFGWDVHVSPDPQYGGYGRALLDGKDVAGIAPTMSPEAPTAWSMYIGTEDAAALGDAVTAAGGTVVMPAFDVGDQGRMAVFQDPTGAFISAWQVTSMGGFQTTGPGTFGWAELNARGVDRAVTFYETVFGWTDRTSDIPDGTKYIEFLQGTDSIAGALEMHSMVPAQVPSYWMVYFSVADVDASYAAALAAGAQEMLPPRDFPGGRFAILSDPQGATFGLLKTAPRA